MKRPATPAAAPAPPVAMTPDAQLLARLALVEQTIETLVEVAGRDNVRRARARLTSARALANLAEHVTRGRLCVARAITRPETMVVEFSERTLDGIPLTESVVMDLASIEPAQAAQLDGLRVGETISFSPDVQIQILRVWNTVPSRTWAPSAPGMLVKP